jgi:hypothetical protein
MALAQVKKDPGATLTYTFSWQKYCARAGVNITILNWVVPEGLTKVAQALDASNKCTVRLSGGVVNKEYHCICKVTLSNGDVDERTLIVSIREQ